MGGPSVSCADIGLVKQKNFGWAGSIRAKRTNTTVSGTDMGELAKTVSSILNDGAKVALGFECPLFVPLRECPADLTKARTGETSPNWIGGVGSTVLATGLPQVTWILREIRRHLRIPVSAYLDWKAFCRSDFG